MTTTDDLRFDVDVQTHVGTVEIRRPPKNHFDVTLIRALAEVFEELDDDPTCRGIVLCSAGKHFCAGRDFGRDRREGDEADQLYEHALRLVAIRTPWVAAIQGAAIGGGLGLAMAADLRVAGARAWFSANFARLGISQGFGLSVTLPGVIGRQHAAELLYTGRRLDADAAGRIGLVDRVAEDGEQRRVAVGLATEIAGSAPLAVRSIRETLRGDLVERFRDATIQEAADQRRLRATADHREGVAAARERRTPRFVGR